MKNLPIALLSIFCLYACKKNTYTTQTNTNNTDTTTVAGPTHPKDSIVTRTITAIYAGQEVDSTDIDGIVHPAGDRTNIRLKTEEIPDQNIVVFYMNGRYEFTKSSAQKYSASPAYKTWVSFEIKGDSLIASYMHRTGQQAEWTTFRGKKE